MQPKNYNFQGGCTFIKPPFFRFENFFNCTLIFAPKKYICFLKMAILNDQ